MAAQSVSVRDNACGNETCDYRMHGGLISMRSYPSSTTEPTHRGGYPHLHFGSTELPSSSALDLLSCPAAPTLGDTTALELADIHNYAEFANAVSSPTKRLPSTDSLLDLGHALSSPDLSTCYAPDNLLGSSVISSLISVETPSTEQRKHGTTLAHNCISAVCNTPLAGGAYALTHSFSMEAPRAPALCSQQHMTSISYDGATSHVVHRAMLPAKADDGRLDLWNLHLNSGGSSSSSSRLMGASILELAEEAVLLRQEGCTTRLTMQSLGWRAAQDFA